MNEHLFQPFIESKWIDLNLNGKKRRCRRRRRRRRLSMRRTIVSY